MPKRPSRPGPPRANAGATFDPPPQQVHALNALYTQGQHGVVLDQAEALVARFPRSFVLRQLLGAARFSLGRLDQAAQAFRHACQLRPDSPDAHSNLGAALFAEGKLEEAIAAYRRAIAINPNYANAYSNLAHALRDQGRLEEAVAAARRAIAISPDHADAHSNLGTALYDLGQLQEAIAVSQRAIAINPHDADAHSNLGAALFAQGRQDEAIAASQRAIAINPNHANAHSNLGNALRAQDRVEEAILAYRRAIAIKPNHADAHSNLGNALYDQGKLEEAIAAYRRAIAINPNLADGVWNLSIALLTAGHFTPGWSEHEWRWKRRDAPRPRPSGKPLWLGGTPLQGQTILLWGEQGLGDQIQFARYASAVAALGARVILQVDDALVRLLEGLGGVGEVVGASTPVPDSAFDVHCPLMSLPLALGTELATIPGVPRLSAHMQEVPRWAGRVPSQRPRIGLAWSGNPKHKNDRNRSLALARLATVLTPQASWISLQKEVRDADRPTFDAVGGIHHFGADLLETAALCEQCDLVISVDTSIAHLAATLGRPVWLLLPFAADWRWLKDRDDSPWYSTMKLYRQQRIGDWEGVLQRVKLDLQRWRDRPSLPS